MKFHESHFEEYVISCEKQNLHPATEKILKKIPNEFKNLKNMIYYGSSDSVYEHDKSVFSNDTGKILDEEVKLLIDNACVINPYMKVACTGIYWFFIYMFIFFVCLLYC